MSLETRLKNLCCCIMEKTVYYWGLAFFPISVTKDLNKSNLGGKGLIWLTIPEESSPPCQGRRGNRQGQVGHILPRLKKQKGNRKLGEGLPLQLPVTHTSSEEPLPKDSTTFPHGAASWGPGVQKHESRRDISHSNHNALLWALKSYL